VNALRLPRIAIAALGLLAAATACQQGATVGPYPYHAATASPTPGGVTPTPTASSGGGASASPTATATATSSASGGATPTATPSGGPTTAAYGPLVISPDPITFGLTSILGATQTAGITQTGYSGPFTIPANGVICSNGVLNIPITSTISGSTLSVTLGLLGVTGSCTITVDGAPGTYGTEVVDLSVPLGTPQSSGLFSFNPNPITFNVLNGVAGNTATSTVSETGYTGAFMLTSDPISCPFNLVPLTKITASLTGDTVTVTTGLLNANLLGSCTVTVEDASGNTGALTVDFQLL